VSSIRGAKVQSTKSFRFEGELDGRRLVNGAGDRLENRRR